MAHNQPVHRSAIRKGSLNEVTTNYSCYTLYHVSVGL
jgi:hypothetical protein